MSIDPVTGKKICDCCGPVCISRTFKSYTFTNPKSKPHRIFHICDHCTKLGAFWCQSCDQIHSHPEICPQLDLFTEVDAEA